MSAGSLSVTALVPAYNAAAFIDETLQSLAAQTYPHLRVLISVDASADDTADRCERFAGGDTRFVVVRQAERLGWIRNSCELLRRAESDLCFFIGHDDVAEPEYVAALVAALAARPAAVLAYSDIELVRPDGDRAARVYAELDGVTERLERGKVVLARTGDWWIPYRGLFRTRVVRRGRPLRRNLAGEFAADWPFMLHVALEGECVRVPRLLYRKRWQVTSLSLSWSFGARERIAVGLCCGMRLLQADLTLGERAALLATLARRLADDVIHRIRLLASRGLRSV